MQTAPQALGPNGPLAKKLEGYEVRQGQLAMARAVEHALENQDTLLVEAGTGTGKTLAYLVPALLSGQRVLISTATKNLQEQIYTKDVPFLLEHLGVKAEVAVLKGRSNYLCLDRLENAPPPVSDDPNLETYLHIERWSAETQTGDRAEVENLAEDHPLWPQLTSTTESCTGSQCLFFDDCFVVKARRRAIQADLLIVNHHLFFADLALREVWDAALIPRPEAIIFDEAHALEDIACHFFGTSLSNWRLRELTRDAEALLRQSRALDEAGKALIRGTRKCSDAFFNCFGSFSPGWSRVQSDNIPETMEEKRRELEDQLNGLQAHLTIKSVPGTPLAALENRTLRLRDALVSALDVWDTKRVHCVERRGRGVFLHDLPIRVAEHLSELLYGGGQSIVFTSATLTTAPGEEFNAFRHFIERMGVDPLVPKKVVQSPFDYTTQSLLYLPEDLPFPQAPEFMERASEEARRIIQVTGGRAFLLFTSHRMLNLFYDALAADLGFPTFRQGDAPKEALLEAFRQSKNGVLFGTSSFWEGVDVAGDALSCVIIDKLPFLSPGDPLIQARMEELETRGISPFQEYQLPSAILSLKQGFGRLIRRREDRGVVVILDRRIQKYGYGKAFLSALPPCPQTTNFEVFSQWVAEKLPKK